MVIRINAGILKSFEKTSRKTEVGYGVIFFSPIHGNPNSFFDPKYVYYFSFEIVSP